MPADDQFWLSRRDAASLCGLSSRQFDQAIRPRMEGGERGAGKTLRFDARVVVAGLVAYRVEQVAPAQRPPGLSEEDALLYGDGDSPNLERLRGAKADLAEMDLDERRGTHADVRALDGALMRFAGLIRRGGEVLQRKFGNEASEILNDAIGEAEQAWAVERQKHGGDDGPDAKQS